MEKGEFFLRGRRTGKLGFSFLIFPQNFIRYNFAYIERTFSRIRPHYLARIKIENNLRVEGVG